MELKNENEELKNEQLKLKNDCSELNDLIKKFKFDFDYKKNIILKLKSENKKVISLKKVSKLLNGAFLGKKRLSENLMGKKRILNIKLISLKNNDKGNDE